jgi:hypothetical protein
MTLDRRRYSDIFDLPARQAQAQTATETPGGPEKSLVALIWAFVLGIWTHSCCRVLLTT